jgi:hypothetical protein
LRQQQVQQWLQLRRQRGDGNERQRQRLAAKVALGVVSRQPGTSSSNTSNCCGCGGNAVAMWWQRSLGAAAVAPGRR